MVFGWGKKKEKEDVKEIPSKKEVELSEVEKITQDLLKLRNAQTLAEIKSLKNQVSPLIKELAGIIKKLEKDDLKVDEIDKHIRIIVVRGKKQVIDVIKKEATDLPDISSIEDVSEMSHNLNQKLKKIGDVLGRQTRVIHIFAKKYADKLKEILETMNSNSREIDKIIKNFQGTKNSFDEITELIQQVSGLNSEIKNKNNRISELEDSINSLKEEIHGKQNSIDKITSSKEYREFLKLNQEYSEFSDTKNQIKNQIDSQFTKISRPLSRYEYSSSLDKDQKLILSQLINQPFEALKPENKDPIIVILENVRKGISSGSISVKDIEKSENHLTETEELLDSFINKVREFETKSKEFQNKLKSFDNEQLSFLKHNLEKDTSNKNDIETTISTLKKDIEENKASIPTKIFEIQQKLKKFSNTDYTIIDHS